MREVASRSAGLFKATSVAGYERAERMITVERFCRLAEFYGVSPARLLAHAVRAAEGIPPILVDLTQLDTVPGREGARLAEFVTEVSRQRGEEEAVISLRAGDLEVLATITGHSPAEFLQLIQRVLRSSQNA